MVEKLALTNEVLQEAWRTVISDFFPTWTKRGSWHCQLDKSPEERRRVGPDSKPSIRINAALDPKKLLPVLVHAIADLRFGKGHGSHWAMRMRLFAKDAERRGLSELAEGITAEIDDAARRGLV
jgi:hypothetical protein